MSRKKVDESVWRRNLWWDVFPLLVHWQVKGFNGLSFIPCFGKTFSLCNNIQKGSQPHTTKFLDDLVPHVNSYVLQHQVMMFLTSIPKPFHPQQIQLSLATSC